jgi:hypothetical protein
VRDFRDGVAVVLHPSAGLVRQEVFEFEDEDRREDGQKGASDERTNLRDAGYQDVLLGETLWTTDLTCEEVYMK